VPGDMRQIYPEAPRERADHSLTVDPPACDAPLLRALRDYWEAKRGRRAMPGRRDFDPAEIPSLLPHVFMLDVLPGGGDFRFRLLGSEITRRYGRDSTGKTLRDVYAVTSPTMFDQLTRLMTAVVESRRPVLSRSSLAAVSKDFVAYEAIHLPLSDDGQSVNIILGGTSFARRR
jgi:hypothetical protein